VKLPDKLTPEQERALAECLRVFARRGRQLREEREQKAKPKREEKNEMNAQEIKKAVEEKRAVIRYSHGNWENVGQLLVFDTLEEAHSAAKLDTRGHCYSMADEQWSHLCTDYQEALDAQAGALVQR